MSNEQYLYVSYLGSAGLGIAAALGTALILAGAHREATGGAAQRLGHLFRRAFPPWLVLAVALGFVSVSYIDCEHRSYEAVVADRAHLDAKVRELVSAMAAYLAVGLGSYASALVLFLWARARQTGISAKPPGRHTSPGDRCDDKPDTGRSPCDASPRGS